MEVAVRRQHKYSIEVVFAVRDSQWSFRETGTMATLASQAEIGVWVQALAAIAGIRGYITPGKIFETVYSKSCNLVHFWRS